MSSTQSPSPARVLDHYAVLGNPVAHSQSPFIHAAFAEQTGEPVAYARLCCPLDGFATALSEFEATGARGCNVTVPFKFEAWALAARRSARAELAGAANTLRFDADGRWADNTDGVGLVHDIQHNAGLPLAGLRVLLVGAGGAGAGALGPLLEARPRELVLCNRSPARATELIERHAALAQRCGVVARAAALADPGKAFDVVINASAASLKGEALGLPATAVGPGALAVDLMYGAPAQPFLAWAAAAGATPRDGLGMLVEQAAEAFLVWRGVRPATAAVLAALRQRLDAPA